MRVALDRVPLMLLALGFAACVTRGDIEEIKETQKKILAQLDKGGRPQMPQQPQKPQGPDPAKTYAFPLGESAVKGGQDAWVTIVEVSDFQCPYCGRVVPTIKALEEKYGKDLRVTFKHNPLPFHPNALPAANAAECAREQGKFWQMHDKLFENQQQLSPENYEKWAGEVGLDLNRWKKCFADTKFKSHIEEDQKMGMQLGARGTPAFFVNGRFLSGAQPQPAFEALIDEEMKKAKASGVAAKDYYQKVVVDKGEKAM